MYAFGNLSTIISPSYEVFCEKNAVGIEGLSGGMLSAITSLQSTHLCDDEALDFVKDGLFYQIERLIQANSGQFCA